MDSRVGSKIMNIRTVANQDHADLQRRNKRYSHKKAAALGFETSKLLFLDHDKLYGKANSTEAKKPLKISSIAGS